MPDGYQETRLWRTTLAVQEDDQHASARERLRSSFTTFRTRVALLAAEIHRSLPDYTVHDISHLDALWEVSELIAGAEFSLTPPEAFALGGAFLLHDLGMGLASYPNGLEDLKAEPSWRDTVVKEFSASEGRKPSDTELHDPPRNIQDRVVATLLRLLHAKHAERLPTTTWTLGKDDTPQFLIEDTEIRQAFGRTIGRIAHSHWWPVDRLDSEFARPLGAPYWCPREWTIDPLKLSAILRVSDAAHIDARRAPQFLRRVRRPEKYSDHHWSFQEKLQKPQIAEDALVFTSGHAFTFAEAPAWWLCLETLEMIDDELRRVDALLADRKLRRFAAKRVAGVDSPERLVAYIPTDGWLPVNAAVQVSDLPRVIQTLGGNELYGRDVRVPVRELIQNAADAVRARRIVDQRESAWGTITVLLGEEDDRYWLEVRDTGIGMSRDVLTRYLLDFGTTYWGSNLMLGEFPGLLTAGFEPTGKYGIGFFATFMLGDGVRVTTRRYDAAQSDTLILEFNTGVSGRPVLRPADDVERLRDGGTAVRVWLRRPPLEQGGLLWRHNGRPISLHAMCAQIAPSLDVTLNVQDRSSPSTVAVAASDWLDLPALELLRRVHDWQGVSDMEFDHAATSPQMVQVAANVRPIQAGDAIYGRACLVPDWHEIDDVRMGGVATVGGLTATPLRAFAGVLLASSGRAARDLGRPLVPFDVLAEWATEQARLNDGLFDADDAIDIVQAVWACGGDPGPLPVGLTRDGYKIRAELTSYFAQHDEVLVGSLYQAEHLKRLVDDVIFEPNVIFTDASSIFMALSNPSVHDLWPFDIDTRWRGVKPGWTMTSLIGLILTALSAAWAIPLSQLAADDKQHIVHGHEATIARSGGRELVERTTAIRRYPTRESDERDTA
jgi:hypothetical protein